MKDVTLGGERLGSGKKNTVGLKEYNRSSHDTGYIWRSTMSSGTLVPFLNMVGLTGGTYDIDLEAECLTHPTIGPLFGSYKVQLDVFSIPIRLYSRQLTMNALNIGLDMSVVKLPQIVISGNEIKRDSDIDKCQIHPSSIFAYLGIRGLGVANNGSNVVRREFNAVPYLGYWDIYKNYYSNKQEQIGAVIHGSSQEIIWEVNRMTVTSNNQEYRINPLQNDELTNVNLRGNSYITIDVTGTLSEIDLSRFIITFRNPQGVISTRSLEDMFIEWEFDLGSNQIIGRNTYYNNATLPTLGWTLNAEPGYNGRPQIVTFPLSNIDQMRENILEAPNSVPYKILASEIEPYNLALLGEQIENDRYYSATSGQEGLALKTYQSDLYNNWLNTEFLDGIDGVGGINNITKISTQDGSFTINELMLQKKVYDMLMRVAVSDGTYDSWLDATYTHERVKQIQTPMYEGGLSKELVFQEVISTAGTGEEPLGTLAGRGRFNNKNKGGKIKVKCDEPSVIMGIVSITPRIDYSQGNEFHTNIKTMNDFHKPGLDEIGFQNLMVDEMAYFQTIAQGANIQSSTAGKVPAWINYQTAVNKVYGNFAIRSEQMYMTLNRRYEIEWEDEVGRPKVKDLTTYIDPSKFNNIFADTRIDAQNFWMQIKVDCTSRLKMSANVIPNL